MSHTTKIKSTPIKDIRALRTAIENLQNQGINVSLLENTAPRMFYADQLTKHLGRQSEDCDYVIRLEDSKYDVGLIRNEQGIYEPVFDSWKGYISNQIGTEVKTSMTQEERKVAPIGKLLQEYTKEATINQAVNQGYVVDSCTLNEENEYVLTLAVQ